MSQTRIIKIGFLILAALLSFLIWREFNSEFNLVNSAGVIYILFLTVLSAAVFILSFFIFDSMTVFGGFLAFFAVFVFTLGFRWEYLIAILPAIIFLSYALLRIKSSIKNSIKIEFHSAVLHGASSLITCLAIFFAFAAYFYPFNISELKVPPKLFEFPNSVLVPLIQAQFPAYTKETTLDDFISLMIAAEGEADLKNVKFSKDTQALILSKLQQSGSIDPQSVMQDTEVQKIIFPELVANIKKNQKTEIAKQRAEFSDRFSIELTGDETIDVLMAGVANSYITKYAASYGTFAPLIIAVATFLGIKSFGFFLNRLSVLFAWILYRVLHMAGLVRVEEVDVKKEKLIV